MCLPFVNSSCIFSLSYQNNVEFFENKTAQSNIAASSQFSFLQEETVFFFLAILNICDLLTNRNKKIKIKQLSATKARFLRTVYIPGADDLLQPVQCDCTNVSLPE